MMPPPSGHGDERASSDVIETSKHVRSDLKKLGALLQEDDLGSVDINGWLSKIRSRCEMVITREFIYAMELRMEDLLWDLHTKVNNWYKDNLKQRQRHKKHVEERKLLKRYLEFIKSSQKYYRGHIQRLAIQHEGIPEVESIALNYVSIEELERTGKYEDAISSEHRQHVLSSCFYALIRLGDLSRWQEQRRADGETNWAPAMGFYDLASKLRPDSGIPHNQIAVIYAATKTEKLHVIYHFYRAATAREPHPTAEANLELEFKKIMATPMASRSDDQDRPPNEVQATMDDLVHWFTILHSKVRAGPVLESHERLEKRVVGYFCNNLKTGMMPRLCMQLVLINLLAEYASAQRADAAPEIVRLVQTRYYFIKFNLRTLNGMLRILLADINAHLNNAEWAATSPDNRVTPIMHCVLPGFRLYSAWLLYSVSILSTPLNDGTFYASLLGDLKNMWMSYANVLSGLVKAFASDELLAIPYLLEEDSETIGFIPFQKAVLVERFLSPERLRKPDRDSISPYPPNKEMLGRIQDLVNDGIKIASVKDCPLNVEFGEDKRPVFTFEPSASFRYLVASHRPMSLFGSAQPSHAYTMSTNSVMEPPSRALSPNTMNQERCEEMVNELVGLDMTPSEPLANFPRFPPVLHVEEEVALPRYSTPPSHSFEDPDFDIDPFNPKHASEPQSDQQYESENIRWLNDNIECGQLEGRMTVGDGFYRVTR